MPRSLASLSAVALMLFAGPALAQNKATATNVPEIPYDSVPNFLKLPPDMKKVIDANGPCCGECTQSWIEGRGNTAGVDREKVLAHLGCVRELYEKKVPDGVTAPGQAATTTGH